MVCEVGLCMSPTYLGITLADDLAARELHDPVLMYVLTCVLPTPATFEGLAKRSPYVVWCYFLSPA